MISDRDQRVIPEAECWRLLSTTSLGQVALSVGALPRILPVQYYVNNRRVVVCLGHEKIPPSSLRDTVLAFGADGIDRRTRAGWWVQVLGHGVPAEQLDGTTCGWPTDGQAIEFRAAQVSGSWISVCPFIESLRSG